MRNTSLTLLAAIVLFLTGCGETHIHNEDTSAYMYIEPDYTAQLDEFHIIDSFNISTEDTATAILDPYIDDGVFDIYWSVNSTRDYIVEYYVNDIPSINGSVFIDAEICGAGLPCNNRGGDSFCQYYADFSLSCSVATPIYHDVSSAFTPVLIDHLITSIPQTLYFILQICDEETPTCEYDYKPVTML